MVTLAYVSLDGWKAGITIVRKRLSFQICYIISIVKIFKLYFFTFVIILIKISKMTRVKTWVKISKVMPQPKSISPRKGREALRQKVQIFRLNLRLNRTYYSLLKFRSKIFQNCVLRSNLQRVTQNSLNSPQIPHTIYYILYFRHLPQQRTLRNSSGLRRFHAIRPHSPRITRNSHQLLTYYYVSDA